MTMNKFFLILFLISTLCGIVQLSAQVPDEHTTPRVPASYFPVSVQFTPVPSGKGWHDERPPLTDETMRETIHNIILHGCTHIAAGEFAHGALMLLYLTMPKA